MSWAGGKRTHVHDLREVEYEEDFGNEWKSEILEPNEDLRTVGNEGNGKPAKIFSL